VLLTHIVFNHEFKSEMVRDRVGIRAGAEICRVRAGCVECRAASWAGNRTQSASLPKTLAGAGGMNDLTGFAELLGVILSVFAGYFAAMRSVNKRLIELEKHVAVLIDRNQLEALIELEKKVAVLIDRDRRKRLGDYKTESENGG
jgi:hypothetical protein